MRYNEFNLANEAFGPVGAKPGAPPTKNKQGAADNMKPGEDKMAHAAATQSLSVPRGNVNPAVADIQKVLLALGYKLPKHGVDGVRGSETRNAIKEFQRDNNLTVDGDPGPETISAINRLIATKKIVFVKSTPADVKAASSAGSIDTKAIQDPDFNKKLDKIAGLLGVESSHLLAIMKMESRVDPSAVNKMSGATGLIQFMPDTARSLGTSVEALREMTAVEQLDYVYKYFKMVRIKPGMDLGDLYMAVFMPKFVGYPNDFVLGQDGGGKVPGTNLSSDLVYKQNKGLDKNKDGSITVADVKSSVQRFA